MSVLNGMQAVQTVRFIFVGMCLLLFCMMSEHLLQTWNVKLHLGRQCSRWIWIWLLMAEIDVTALLERGIWQLMSLTEYLEVGIVLKLSPPAPPEHPQGNLWSLQG